MERSHMLAEEATRISSCHCNSLHEGQHNIAKVSDGFVLCDKSTSCC